VKLHSPTFEKALRRDVRRKVRTSRELKREFRSANKYRKHYNIIPVVRPLISVGVAIGVWHVLVQTSHIASALAVINLWSFLFIFIHAQRLLASLYGSRDLPALFLLPVAEPTIFLWELQRFYRGALWSFLDLFAGYFALAFLSHLSVAKWFAVIPVSIMTWMEVLALAAACVAYLPKLPYQLVSAGLMLTLFALFLARNFVGNAVIALIDICAPSLNLLLPTGWSVSLFQVMFPEGRWVFLGFLVPVGATICTLRLSIDRLRDNYGFKEPVMPEHPDQVPGEVGANRLEETSGPDRPLRVGPTAIAEIVQSRQFLAPPSWPEAGWFERWLWRWFSPRERALAEFAFPNGLSIAAPWRKIFRNLLVTVLGAVAAGIIGPVAEYWVVGVGLFVTVCLALASVLTTGRAFQLVVNSGVNIPLYAGYAIGFRELGSLLLKCSLVQTPLLISFGAISSIFVFYLLHWSIIAGALFGLKAATLILASRFIFLTFSFSSGTNDTSAFRLRSVVLILFVVVFGLGFVGLGGASLFVPNQVAAWLLLGMAGLDAYIFFRVYGWFYHRTRFDLMSLPRH